MEWRLDTPKAVQAVAVLLRDRPGKRDNAMRLLKLLYLANRSAIEEIGRPIFTDRFVAMQRGPLPSGVYDLIKGVHPEVGAWSPHFRRDRYDLVLRHDPGLGRLSPYEVGKLQQTAARFEDLDEWDLVHETHKLAEWVKNDPGTSSRTIPLSDLLDALGMPEREDEIREAMDRRDRVSDAFRRSA